MTNPIRRRLAQAATAAALSLAASKNAVAATLATGAGAATLSAAAGADPLPWVIGALGGLVVIIKFPAVNRANGVANAVISVLLAGLGSEFVAQLASHYAGLTVSRYLAAMALSILWPLSIPVVQAFWPALRGRIAKKIEGQ